MSIFSDLKVFKTKNTKGKIRGNGSVVISDTVRINFTVVEGSKGLFASLPQHTYEKEGKTQYASDVVIFDKARYNEFQQLVTEAFMKLSGGDTPAPTNDQGDDIPF